jgi:cyclopropane-fatty-acyl-phospholipid synthase
VAFGRTAPLRRELEAAFPDRPFAIRFWDGSELAATQPSSPTFSINSPPALAHVLRAPGELGIGRAYATGLVEVDDLDAGIRIFDEFEPPELKPVAIARLGLALIRACGLVIPPRRPAAELRLRGEHTRSPVIAPRSVTTTTSATTSSSCSSTRP